MKNRIIKFLLTLFAIFLFFGCSENSNPLNPDEPGNGDINTEIKKPIYLKLNNIELSRFPSVKPNGDKWDYSVFPNSPTRRPDIYVELYKSGSTNILFKSDTKEDALLKTAYDSYSFNKAGEKNGRNLPLSLDVDQTFKIKIYDYDGLTSNDDMTEFNLRGSTYYKDDNADFVFHTFSSGSYTLKIEGRWVY